MSSLYKRIVGLLIAAAMICAVFPVYTHAASQTEHVSISVTPRQLAEGGNVTVSITLTNTNSASQPTVTNTPTPTPGPTSVAEPTATPTPTPEPTQPPEESTPEPTDEPVEGGDKANEPVEGSNKANEPVEGFNAIGMGVSLNNETKPEYSTRGQGDYTNISISNSYGVSFSTSGVVISPGSRKTFTATMQVSSGMIGIDLPFTVSWSDNGQPRSETVTCKISRLNASPYLSVIRTANPVNATEGTEVTIVYTFTNSGSVKLTDITLVDRYVKGSSSAMLSPFSLDPGATKEFVYTMTMGNKTIVSSPVVTFYAHGSSTQLVKNVSSLTIGLIQSQLTKEVIKGDPTPQGVQFTLYLTNNGNQKLSSLVVKDELGNNLSGNEFSLAVGETNIIRYTAPNPTSVRNLVFYITGVDYNNTEFKDNTTVYVVRPYIDTSLFGLSFSAVTTSSANENNMIGIEFNLENTGALEIFNLSVTEKELGYELYSKEGLSVGASDRANVDVNIGEIRDLVFILTSEDSSGNTYTHEAYVTADQIDVSSMIPANDPGQNDGNVDIVEDPSALGRKLDGLITDTGEKLMSWFRILGIIAGAAAVAMLALGISEIVIRRNRRSSSKSK